MIARSEGRFGGSHASAMNQREVCTLLMREDLDLRSSRPRIAFYTHDTFGMGHVRRCMNMIDAVARRRPDAAVLLVSGSPALSFIKGLPPGADVVKLPTIAPTGAAANRPAHLPIGTEELVRVRSETITALISAFAPDVFVVDNFPFGARRELLPTLQALRQTATPIVLSLRDIVDAPEVVRRRWAREGVLEALREIYDRILVFGEEAVFDIRREYGLDTATAAKVRHCGYIARRAMAGPPSNAEFASADGPRILITVGGGGDGLPLLDAAIGALALLPDVSALILSGPLQGTADRSAMLAQVSSLAGRVTVKPFVEDPTGLMGAADLVLSMAGYNTVAELLRVNARMLLVPRDWRFGEHARGTAAGVEMEQVLRARMLSQAGLSTMLDPAALSRENLANAIRRSLDSPRPERPEWIHFDGAETAASIIDELCRKGARSDAA